ncbi:MAG: penicillin acylase family protein [Bacteroidota bacterium]
MNRPKVSFLFPLIALVIIVFTLSTRMFKIPPLGKLLDPFSGAVQKSDKNLFYTIYTVDHLALNNNVEIRFDARKVPHITSGNNHDLYFAQGYITANLRLWQMDFMSYAAAGRLSEIFDKGYVDYDINQRRIGIVEAAKKSLALIKKKPETFNILTAYTKGVNAYINALSYKDFPLEYKLLDYRPEPWTNLKSVLIMKNMGNTLSGYEEDLFLSKAMLALGIENFNKFFPEVPPHAPGNSSVRLAPVGMPPYLNYSFLMSSSVVSKSSYDPDLGSNSWAVSGRRTKSGYPILASDPHLKLTLPSIWLEMQLSSPDVNVYGVSIPGTPSVIMGFNKDIAWGTTNGEADVKDWYKLKITENYGKYQFDGKWLRFKVRYEEIKRRGQISIYDTVYSSNHGPVVTTSKHPGSRSELMDHALKWTLHKPSDEISTFIKLSKAKNFSDYNAALKGYSTPVQNFTFACVDNTIAVNHQGLIPMKTHGQGLFILDGNNKSHLYSGYIPQDSLPSTVNPTSGEVFSANQYPAPPQYKYYLHGYYPLSRAIRIKQLLEKKIGLDLKTNQKMQLDNVSAFAVTALPVLLKKLSAKKLGITEVAVVEGLSKWNGSYNINEQFAQLFNLWLNNIRDYTWDELIDYHFIARPPSDYVLLDLIENDGFNKYFDKLGTEKIENSEDIITEAFRTALKEYQGDKKNKRWGKVNQINIMHLADIKAFSEINLTSSGHPTSINAISKNRGPSWRMIVELGPKPKGYGIYPGGQSGTIGSQYYNNSVAKWNKGEYFELLFFTSKSDAESNTTSLWHLKK